MIALLLTCLTALNVSDPAPSPAPLTVTPEQCARAVDYSVRHSGRALLVMQNGKIVFEQYDNGWSADRPHPLASGTKSFTGVLAMLAVQDGLLTLDERAADTITEWQTDPHKSQITIRQLLTLSSGLPAGDRELSGPTGSRLLGEGAARRARALGLDEQTRRPENVHRVAIGLDLETDPGTTFQYGPSHFYVFSEVLHRKLARSDRPGKTTLDYLRDRLLKPIGINIARIGRDRAGNPNLPGGMLLTAREWARFGQFVLDDGSIRKPDGTLERLLDPELLAHCFEPSACNAGYGLTWWLRNADPAADGQLDPSARRLASQNRPLVDQAGRPIRIVMAAGLGKQRLYLLPDHDLLIVRFAESTPVGQRFNDAEFLSIVLGLDR